MRIKKVLIVLTGISFLLWSCKSQQVLPSQNNLPRVENVHFTQESDTVNVFYDLLARSQDSRFNIKLMLSLGDNKTYEIDATTTSGAIGSGVAPGKKKKISWKVLEDFPQGIKGKQIQFIVNAQQQSSSNKDRKWIYIVSGALVLAAGAVLGYIFLSQGGDSGSLPPPPSRPDGN